MARKSRDDLEMSNISYFASAVVVASDLLSYLVNVLFTDTGAVTAYTVSNGPFV